MLRPVLKSIQSDCSEGYQKVTAQNGNIIPSSGSSVSSVLTAFLPRPLLAVGAVAGSEKMNNA